MIFTFPWAWLWLLALLPVLLLYFLRKRERDWPVSALFLWEGVRQDRPRFVERLRARFDLLLFLQILAVVLSALVLSRPAREVLRLAGATLLVLDASASTAAEGSREKILAAAEQILRTSAGPWAAALWTDPPEILFSRTSDLSLALSGLRGYQPRLTRRPELAKALALFPEKWPRVVVITDNPPRIAGAEVITVPRPENLGITRFSVRPSPDGLRYEAFLRVLNATQNYKDVQVRVISEAGEFWAARLLPPGAEEEMVLVLPGVRPGAFVAELRPGDAFPWDNVRYFVVEGREVAVGWLGPGDRFLWAALQARDPVRRVDASPDLFVLVSTDLEREPSGPCLLVGAGIPGAARRGEAEPGPLRAEEHAVLQNVSLREWRLGRVLQYEVPKEAQVALWSGDYPLLFLWESPAGRRAAVAVDLAQTNLPLLPDFPILISNLLAWLLPQEPGGTGSVGEAVEIPSGFSVLTAGGRVEGVWVPPEPGIFVLEGPKTRRFLAVNVPWDAFRPHLPPASAAAEGFAAKTLLPLWPWAALALVLTLGLEALVFLRRGG